MNRVVRLISALVILFVSRAPAAQPISHVDFHARWGFLLVPVSPSDGCPVERADAPLAELRTLCSEFAAKALASKGRYQRRFADSASACVDKYYGLYLPALQQKYSRADFGEVAERLKSSSDLSRLECLLAASHNARLSAEIEEKQAAWDAEEAQVNGDPARIDAARAAVLKRESSGTDNESAARKALRALGLVMQGMGQGLAGASRNSGATPVPPQPSTPSVAECTSDYACGVGFVCVKDTYSVRGYCTKGVNAYGVPQLNPPRSESVGVKTPASTDCLVDSDCPSGFRCQGSSGACIR